MLTLINTDRMQPPIAPIGLDYIAGTLREEGLQTDILDLCFAEDASTTLRHYFATTQPELVGLSFRNVDDCFWPSAAWFVPELTEIVRELRNLTPAPIVLGGVGFSIFAERIVEYTEADFGIRGDGEQALVSLAKQLAGPRKFEKVPGLIWRRDGAVYSNPPAWPDKVNPPTTRDAIDNRLYFEKGGQIGLETKRGCNQKCTYCADPLAKGPFLRLRSPSDVADEAESLLQQGIDVLHLCDSEFNIPGKHAMAVCEEFVRRGLGERLRWYAYLKALPFDAELAVAMKKAGCAGIDFTGDSASGLMLNTYGQNHLKQHLASAVKFCRDNEIKAMVDLLLGGPGETKDTLTESIEFIKEVAPYACGASLGLRIYPATKMAEIIAQKGPLEDNPAIRRKYDGPIDFLKPTFYISPALGERPAEYVKDLICGDKRFFEPIPEIAASDGQIGTDHNYSDNSLLVQAIENGARGAYWDILRGLKN